MLDKNYFNELLDFYQVLLTERQSEIMNYYYREDYSLSEISENLGISKSAVGDIIKRVQKSLLSYEERLQLLEKHKKRLCLGSNNRELYEQLLKIEEGD